MALDMANSAASSAAVRVIVSFYLVATDESSFSATLAIHKEKFSVLLNGDEPNDLFKIMKLLITFTGLAEIAKSKGLGENPEVMIVISCSFIILRYKKLFFAGM